MIISNGKSQYTLCTPACSLLSVPKYCCWSVEILIAAPSSGVRNETSAQSGFWWQIFLIKLENLTVSLCQTAVYRDMILMDKFNSIVITLINMWSDAARYLKIFYFCGQNVKRVNGSVKRAARSGKLYLFGTFTWWTACLMLLYQSWWPCSILHWSALSQMTQACTALSWLITGILSAFQITDFDGSQLLKVLFPSFCLGL